MPDSINPGYPQLHWHGPVPDMPMPTVWQLSRRIANTEILLRMPRINGEYALELEQNLATFRAMLTKVLALTAGVATCA